MSGNEKLKTRYLKDLTGIWHITSMSSWDKEYFDAEVKAHIRIENNGTGEFQFGLVYGEICGEFKSAEKIFDFTWDGNDECDDANGDGWTKLKGADILEGEIRFHSGDHSTFLAKRVGKK